MSKAKKYRLNPITLSFEAVKIPVRRKVVRWALFFVLSFAAAALCIWLWEDVLGLKSPKTAILEARNTALSARLEVGDARLLSVSSALAAMESRDRDIYRPMFGLDDIADPGADTLFWINVWDGSTAETGSLKATLASIYRLDWRCITLGNSFDEVYSLALKAGDMASCVPCIPPICPDPEQYTFSSPFGYRTDPKWGGTRRHTGIDLATDRGNPVYATGDGVVELTKSEAGGYGNSILINHGFGYKTRYAHLLTIGVEDGMTVKRGDNIGFTGCSGKSTGPHLHYEVLYRNDFVNPLNFMDLSMPVEDWQTMVRQVDWQGGKLIRKRR